MTKELKYRLMTIGVLILASIASLWPRSVVERIPGRDGEPARYDTVKRIPLKQGLDLKGGIFMALEIDESDGVVTDKNDALDRVKKVVETRIDQFGVAEPNIQRSGSDRINVELPGISDPLRAQELIKTVAMLEFKITDESRELERAMPAMDRILRQKGIIAGADTPIGEKGAAKDLFTTDTGQADSATAAKDSQPVRDTTGALSSRIIPYEYPGEYIVPLDDQPIVSEWLKLDEVKLQLRANKELLWGSDSISIQNKWYRFLYVVEAKEILSGQDLVNAQPFQDPTEGSTVNFKVSNAGARRFYSETSKNVQKFMAIILDKKVIGRPPVIKDPISTNGRITMPGRPIADANDLALVLRAGALPVKLKIAETRNIGPSLGRDSIDKGVRAALLAVALVVVIMAVYYRFSGLLVIAGLSCYMIMTLGVLAGFGAVITLPGVAGFVLSIGIAVDANVLILERIREELDHGKTVRTAVDEGFRHAMSAIIDSNVTTILTSLVLYQFGTGPVRGFAVTLIAGIIASMITGIFIVRTFFLLWLNRTRGARALSI